jgi:hypothetical protein
VHEYTFVHYTRGSEGRRYVALRFKNVRVLHVLNFVCKLR